MRQIILIAHNVRSTHNVGSLLRTAEGLGVQQVFFTGYTPYPMQKDDSRLPHIARKLDSQIHKTALDAEKLMKWSYVNDVFEVITQLQSEKFHIAAIEQASNSVALPEYAAPDKIVVVVGREVEGLEPEILAISDTIVEIPMLGQKESFNVVQAAAMALYHCRFS